MAVASVMRAPLAAIDPNKTRKIRVDLVLGEIERISPTEPHGCSAIVPMMRGLALNRATQSGEARSASVVQVLGGSGGPTNS